MITVEANTLEAIAPVDIAERLGRVCDSPIICDVVNRQLYFSGNDFTDADYEMVRGAVKMLIDARPEIEVSRKLFNIGFKRTIY